MFGKETPIVLVLLDIAPMAAVLEGVQFELQDCALANLRGSSILRSFISEIRSIIIDDVTI